MLTVSTVLAKPSAPPGGVDGTVDTVNTVSGSTKASTVLVDCLKRKFCRRRVRCVDGFDRCVDGVDGDGVASNTVDTTVNTVEIPSTVVPRHFFA